MEPHAAEGRRETVSSWVAVHLRRRVERALAQSSHMENRGYKQEEGGQFSYYKGRPDMAVA